jgi:hypothetical protein
MEDRTFWIIYLLLVLVALILSLAYFPTGDEYIIKEVKCYDRFSKEIKGEVCLEKIYCPIYAKYFSSCESFLKLKEGGK